MNPLEALSSLEGLVHFNRHLSDDKKVSLELRLVRSIYEGFEEMAGIIREQAEEIRHLTAHLNGEEHEHLSSGDGVQV